LSQSPLAITGVKGGSAQVLDIASEPNTAGSLIFTANSDNSVSEFVIGSNGTVTAMAGSPYANPDSPAGTSGNPASLAVDPYTSQLFGLDSGSSSLSIWAIDRNTGALSYAGVQQAGNVKSTVTDKIRGVSDVPIDCLVTSNGYGLTINFNTGQTSIASGSPVLNPLGDYPSVAVPQFSPPF